MLYPLSSVHRLIYETIHPETMSLSQTADLPADTLNHLKHEIEASRLHLFSQLNQASGADSLKVIVYTCQAGYVSLINRLGSYMSQPELSSSKSGTEPLLQIQYREIRRLLIAHMNELYQYYAPFFDPEQMVPKFVVYNKQHKIKHKLETVRKHLPRLCNDSVLLSIISVSIERMVDSKQLNLSYRQLYYVNLFLTELIAFCVTNTPSTELPAFTDFLIRTNFNESRFINYIIEQLRDQITDDMSLPEQAEKWAFHVKEFHQIVTTTSYCLYPQRQPVKECLIHAAEQELHFIKQKMLLSPNTHEQPLPAQKEKRIIATSLTISQLGVLVRLLVDCKMIQNDNQSQLLKTIADGLRTTKAAQISAESLRVRYYNPDRASISITKEYLLQMLKQLSQY